MCDPITAGALIGGGLGVAQGGDLGDVVTGAALGAGGGWAFGGTAAAGGEFLLGDAYMPGAMSAGALGDAYMPGALAGEALGAEGALETLGAWNSSTNTYDEAFDPFATTEGVNQGWNTLTGYGLGSGYSGGALSALSNLGAAKTALSYAAPVMSIGSGLYGMTQADALRKQAALAAQRADPWGMSGGRSVADSQLQELLGNPGQVAARDPSYALRMQGAQRANATYGQDSGAMAVAGANASTDWYNQRFAQLGGISGATVNPGTAEQIGLQGSMGASDLASKSLASIGYGVTQTQDSSMLKMLASMKQAGLL